MIVRRKISIGFVIVGFILLLSSLIAIFEFYIMKKTVANVVTSDISSINTSRLLLEIADEYNYKLLGLLGDTTIVESELINIEQDDRFIECIRKEKFSTVAENKMVDSVLLGYASYIKVASEVEDIWKFTYNEKNDWYLNRMYPTYTQLREYIKKLNLYSQSALEANSENLSDSFYRSLMPCVVAVGIGIILLFLFNYFLNFYFLSPLEKITKGIKTYLTTRKGYNYSLDSQDEMQDLNDSVREIISENKNIYRENNTHI